MSDYTVSYTAPCPGGPHEAVWRGTQAGGNPDVICDRCEPLTPVAEPVPLYRPRYLLGASL